jgi:putative thioredoxin
MPAVIDVTEATFDEAVLAASHEHPVVVDFWAEWCGPCRMLGPVLESLAEEADGAWTLAKIDTDANQGLAGRFHIRGIPAVKAFVDGKVVAEFTGVQGEGWLRDWLGGLAPSPGAQATKAARAAWAAGDTATATAQLNTALQEEPPPAGALVLAAQLSLEAGSLDEARAFVGRLSADDRTAHAAELGPVLARLESGGKSAADWETALAADPDNLELHWSAAHAHAAEGAHEPALAHLLHIVRTDRGFREDGARQAMLALFQQLGRSPLTRRFERKLQMTLF